MSPYKASAFDLAEPWGWVGLKRCGGGSGRPCRTASVAKQEAARGAGATGGDGVGRSQRQPDGAGCRRAARGRAVGHALPMDQPAARQCAHRHRRGDGALRARSSGARLRWLSRPRGDHRPEQGQRRPPHGDGVAARGRARPASGLEHEEDPRRHRLSRAARGLGDGRRPTARGGAPHADGRSFLWLARGDRLVSRSRLGVGGAVQTGSGRGWRLRCKQDLRVFDNGGETTLAACFARGEHRLENVALTGKRARTHVAMVQEEGQAEPWIIAMSERPTPGRARDYGLRWGIEAMFSDFKTRGFNLEASHIERTDRLDRLVLVLALALYWAVSTGLWDAHRKQNPRRKKAAAAQRKNVARSLMSLFKRGLRRIRFCLQRLIAPPPLWTAWKNDGW